MSYVAFFISSRNFFGSPRYAKSHNNASNPTCDKLPDIYVGGGGGSEDTLLACKQLNCAICSGLQVAGIPELLTKSCTVVVVETPQARRCKNSHNWAVLRHS